MKKILPALCSLCFMIFLILASVLITVNSRSFYTKQYEKNNTRAATGMSAADLDRATNLLLNYLSGKRDDLNLTVNKNGVPRQVFDERETAHMVDVKALYQNAQYALMLSWFAFVLLWAMIIKKYKAEFAHLMLSGYKFTVVLTVIMCIFLGVAFTTGFNTFWNNFHMVFFSNDLWLLDPKISTMINMFPLPFWLSMCTRILITFLALFILEYVAYKVMDLQVKSRQRQ